MVVKRRPGLVSVILVNYRGTDDTVTAIRHLRELDWLESDLEIVVVDNDSGDDSVERLRREAGIVLVESSVNSGFAGGCNAGVAASHGEFVAFLNNDARPDRGWVRAAVEVFDSSPRIGAVASKVLDWEGTEVDYVDAAVTWYGMGYKPHAGESDRGSWDDPRDVLFGTGAAMFVRAEVYEQLQGFDETYFMFYEDVDLGWRLNLLGHRFRYEPRSLAYHKHHASMNKLGSFKETYLLERNALYTLYKNLGDDALDEVFGGALLLAVRRAVARGGLDSTSLDIRRGGADDTDSIEIRKETAAGLFALDQFVEHLPGLRAERERIQSTRVRSDRQVGGLFGNTDEPAYPIDSYLRGYEKIVDTLGQLIVERRRRILVVTGDAVGVRMAGPAIRAWNIARLLAEEHQVRLVSMSRAETLGADIETAIVSPHRPESIAEHEEWADVIIVQGHALELFPKLERSQKVLVVDIYDPLHLEQLEQGRNQPVGMWNDQVQEAVASLNHQLLLGDFFICASELQRNFWLGQLAALGRVNAFTYTQDNDLDALLAIAPFGMPSEPPVSTGAAMRGVVPGIGDDDAIAIWAGGIYDWFDPETLIRAVARLAERRPNLRLFFMGVTHPNPAVPEMDVVTRSRALSRELGVLDRHVFFNETWVPYDLRQNYLLEADLGVSTHFQHVETTFSFRTRILDYLWAGLPIVSTAGDSFAQLIAAESLGDVVVERDVSALADALERQLYDPTIAERSRRNVAKARAEFTWERALAPLIEFCRDPHHAADKRTTAKPKRGDKGVRAAAVYQPPKRVTGRRRDVQRVLYYLREGGPATVLERTRARIARRREAKIE